jgi:hypothetical protein
MQSPSLNFPFEGTALFADTAASHLEQTPKQFTEDSYWLRTSRSSVVSMIDNPVACTFIIPSRSRQSRKNVKDTQAPTPAKHDTEVHNQLPLMPTPEKSPRIVAFQEPTMGMSESSSSGTFGAFYTWDEAQTVTISSPGSDRFRRVQSLPQRPPLVQPFAPPRFSIPVVESLYGISADGTALLTPMEGPFLSEMGRVGDGAGELSTSDTRASLFTISAYSRTDNLKTPVVCSDLQEIVKSPVEPTKRVLFTNANQEATNVVEINCIAVVPSTSTTTVCRPHRLSPLTLEQDDVTLSHPEVARNVSHNTASSAGYIDSGQSSAVEEAPVHRVMRRGARYTQPSALPSLPIVEFVKRVCVELRIDQEEHRTIRPQFTFKRHIAKPKGQSRTAARPPTASKISDAFWENVTPNGLVDMRMPARELGTFHCGVSLHPFRIIDVALTCPRRYRVRPFSGVW